MLLRDGILYTSHGRDVTAFSVVAEHYDYDSPWPVRFHDNQRTGFSEAPLTH